MTKFIGVSLTLLLVASMASAVVIEPSYEATLPLIDRVPAMLTDDGFSSGAIAARDTGMILGKTATFKALPYELKNIVSNVGEEMYFKKKGVVLDGKRYALVKTDSGSLAAEIDGRGVLARLASGVWIIGVYGQRLTRDEAEKVIDQVVDYFNEELNV